MAVFFITFSPFIRLPRRYVGYNIAHIAYPVNRQIKNFFKISKPLLPSEEQYQRNEHHDTHNNYHKISIFPVELRHARKVHAVPAREQSKRQKDNSHNREKLHQIVLLDRQLRLIFLLKMLDNIAQILHRLEIAVGAVLENSEAFRRRVRKYGIVVCRSFVKNQSQLLIVALYSQQLASPGGQLFKNILAGLALE